MLSYVSLIFWFLSVFEKNKNSCFIHKLVLIQSFADFSISVVLLWMNTYKILSPQGIKPITSALFRDIMNALTINPSRLFIIIVLHRKEARSGINSHFGWNFFNVHTETVEFSARMLTSNCISFHCINFLTIHIYRLIYVLSGLRGNNFKTDSVNLL